MTISFVQAFNLIGAGMLAAAGLIIWLAGSLSMRHGETGEGPSGCLLALLVLTFLAGCVFLVCKALL